MSEKDKEDFSPTEDYLAQVEWQARDRHRSIGGIFSFFFFGLIALIVFFAVRDAQKRK